jgi:hypothetical protein
MAKMVLKAAFLSVNGVDESSNCSKIELTTEVEEKDVTTFASNGWKEVLGGVASAGLSVGIKNDVASSQIDSRLWALFGTVTTFEVRASNAAVGASNPKYTGSVLIKELKPINGSVGDVNEADLSWPSSGAVTRATS